MTVVAANLEDPTQLIAESYPRRGGTVVLAVFLPLAAGLLMVGEVLTPQGLDKPTTTLSAILKALPIAAAHSTQLYVSNLLVIFGLGALAVSFAAISTLADRRNASFAITAAVIGGSAAFCGALANVLVGFNLAAAATAHTTAAAAAQVLLSGNTSAVARMLLVAYLAGGLVAIMVMGIALWRSKTMPRWLPILFGLGLVLAATSPPGVMAIAIQLPFAIAMVLFAARVWNSSRPTRASALL